MSREARSVLWPLDGRALPVYLALSAATAAFNLGYLWNTDVWWYLASGAEILDRGAVPSHDVFVYSLSEPATWLTHSWLWTVALAAADRAFGLEALPVIQAVLVWGLLTLVFTRGRIDRVGVVNALLVAGIVVAGATRLALRAELPGWLLWCVYIVVFERTRFGWRSGVLLLVLHWLWANLHGAYVLGLIPAFAYSAGGWAQARRARRAALDGSREPVPVAEPAPLWFPAALLLVSLAAPPFAERRAEALWADLTGIFSGGSRAELQIVEWQGVFSQSFEYLPWLYAVLVLTGALSFVAARPPRSWPRIILFLGAAVLPVLAVRFLVGLAITTAMVGIPNLADARPLLSQQVRPIRSLAFLRSALAAGLAVTVCAALVAITAAMWRTRAIFEVGQSGDRFYSLSPVVTCPGAADFILAHDLRGPIFNGMGLGGYLEARLYPTHQLFIDSRILDPSLLDTVVKAQWSPEAWRALDAHYGFQTVVLSNLDEPWSRLHEVLTADPDWDLVFLDVPAAVFVRDADASLKLGLADDGASEAPIDSFLSPQPIAGIGWARLAVYNVLREGPHILLRNYLRSLLQLGRAQEVESRATRALSLTGEAPIWRLLRGRARIRLERYAEAERDLAAVVRRAPTNVPALLEHGVALIHLGRRSEALRELDRAYALDRDYPGLTRLRRQLRAGVR